MDERTTVRTLIDRRDVFALVPPKTGFVAMHTTRRRGGRFSEPSCHDDRQASSGSGQRGPPPRPTRHVAAGQDDSSSGGRTARARLDHLTHAHDVVGQGHRTALPRCLAIVLCTDRRGAAVLCDQVSIIHACMHPAGHVRSPNTIVRLIRHRRQQACYALPAPCTQHTRRDSACTACTFAGATCFRLAARAHTYPYG
jgi:hypothetical protein